MILSALVTWWIANDPKFPVETWFLVITLVLGTVWVLIGLGFRWFRRPIEPHSIGSNETGATHEPYSQAHDALMDFMPILGRRKEIAMKTGPYVIVLALLASIWSVDGATARQRDCGGNYFRCTDACNKPGRGGDIRACTGICDVNLDICIRCGKGQGSPTLCQGQPGQPGEKSEDSGTHPSDQPPKTGTGTYQPPAPQSPGTYQPPAGGEKSQH